MAYMAAQWVTDQARASFAARPLAAAAELAELERVRAWLRSLDLDGSVTAAIDEPLGALEDGLRAAARGGGGDAGATG